MALPSGSTLPRVAHDRPRPPQRTNQDSHTLPSAPSAPGFGDSRPRKGAPGPDPTVFDAAACCNDVMKDADRFSRVRRPVGAGFLAVRAAPLRICDVRRPRGLVAAA